MFLLKTVDNTRYRSKVFRLHSSVTVFLLIFSALLIGARLSFFNLYPVNCISNKYEPDQPASFKSALNQIGYNCLSDTTVNIFFDEFSNDSVYLNSVSHFSEDELPERTPQAYYFMGPALLFVQAFFFLLPSIIWTLCEKGFTKHLKEISTTDQAIERSQTLSSFLSYQTFRDSYALAYYWCELLCMVNVIFQFVATDYYIGGNFWSYGIDVVKYLGSSGTATTDPKSELFPTKTTCSYRSLFLNSSVESEFKPVIYAKTKKGEITCELELNIMNREIYLLIWFWFAFLLVALAFVLFYRLMILLAYRWRGHFLSLPSSVPTGYLNYVCKSSIGNFFILSICSSFEVVDMDTILREIGEELEEIKAKKNLLEGS